MRDDMKLLGEAFQPAPRRFARVVPAGFLLGEQTCPVLRGTIRGWKLVRKLFRGGRLVCSADDGVEGNQSRRCETCRRDGCSPRIRVCIRPVPDGNVDGADVHLELNFSSCRNFLRYAQDLGMAHLEVDEVVSVLSVVDRAGWGEVIFETDGQAERCPPAAWLSEP